MSTVAPDLIGRLEAEFEHAVVAFVGDDGYPTSVATSFEADAAAGVVRLRQPSGMAIPTDREVDVIFSHIRPQPEMGYDERRYVNLWGRVVPEQGMLTLRPERSQTWDERETPFFQYSEVSVPQSKKYLEDLGQRTGRRIRPQLAGGWLFLRATRLPFLTATAVPVFLGVAIAALHGEFHLMLALLTFVAACAVQLGLNVVNDIFDTLSGADAANETPTQFSGGSRVIHYGLLSMRQMVLMAAAFYAVAIAIGLWLAVERGFWPMFWIGLSGVLVSIFYTAPPLKLVHRGLGEIAVFLGFGPIMVLGAYYVQAQTITTEAWYASIPVGILIALVLYVNEIPDRPGDAKAGKRTLPVRLSQRAVMTGYAVAVAAAYLSIVVGVAIGLMPVPTLIALATIPLALKVYRGTQANYESPYTLMAVMGVGVNLHLFTGMLLVLGYVIAIAADRLMDSVPVFLRYL